MAGMNLGTGSPFPYGVLDVPSRGPFHDLMHYFYYYGNYGRHNFISRTDGLSENDEMREVFRVLDKEKDGFISAEDLRTVSLLPLQEVPKT